MTDVNDHAVEHEDATSGLTADQAAALHVVGPMPLDPDLLTDPLRRQHVTHFKGSRYPFPIPNGWFVVAESAELAQGEVRALYYFGRDLVLFRGEGGAPYLLDAHCQHLGAHLAVGGKVEGDCVRCPFHGWRFDGESGRCDDIPYGEVIRIPPKAHTRSYPTLERNHMVWAWYHALGEPPFYDVPEVWEFIDEDWSPIIVKTFRINVAAQDMAENNVDFSHFRYVHGTDAIPEHDFVMAGTYKRTSGFDGMFVREGFGLGLSVLRIKGYTTFLSSTTPVEADCVDVRWIFTAPKALGPDAASQAATSFAAGVSQDIPIWENKIYRDPPVITKTEKLILEHRKWSEQFYSPTGG